MSQQEIEGVSVPGFTARAWIDGALLQVRCEGSADMTAAERLDEMMRRVQADAVRAGIREIHVDFGEFEFMNSSCFKSFISLIVASSALPEAQRYKVRFIPGARYHWQRRSLHALKSMAPEIVDVDAIAGR